MVVWRCLELGRICGSLDWSTAYKDNSLVVQKLLYLTANVFWLTENNSKSVLQVNSRIKQFPKNKIGVASAKSYHL